mgnify:CR=1 FL=1
MGKLGTLTRRGFLFGAVFGPRFFLTVAYQCPSVVPASGNLARIFREARNIRPGGADSVGANRDPADAGSPGQAAGGNFGSFTLWFMKFPG